MKTEQQIRQRIYDLRCDLHESELYSGEWLELSRVIDELIWVLGDQSYYDENINKLEEL